MRLRDVTASVYAAHYVESLTDSKLVEPFSINLRFHQLPSISYLPPPTYNLRFQQLPLSTYLQSTVHHLPTSTIRTTAFHLPPHLHYYPSLLDLVTFATSTSKTAGLPCITDGWTTAERRATYPLYRLLTG
ncbi:hypothetical protein SFRURICE_004741 [Spodoptera frugiperda]|nr:hypothetical protein SFRURICE_004741 [Spodoptera frugiperda]